MLEQRSALLAEGEGIARAAYQVAPLATDADAGGEEATLRTGSVQPVVGMSDHVDSIKHDACHRGCIEESF
jgi:hypothetical protein